MIKRERDQSTIDPRQLPQPLVELLKVVHTKLSDDDRRLVAPMLDKVIDDTARRRRILALVQESLSQLRLDLKYLMFDIESTRRERDEALERLNP